MVEVSRVLFHFHILKVSITQVYTKMVKKPMVIPYNKLKPDIALSFTLIWFALNHTTKKSFNMQLSKYSLKRTLNSFLFKLLFSIKTLYLKGNSITKAE